MENTVNFIGSGRTYGKKVVVTLEWKDVLKLKKSEFQGKKYVSIDVFPLTNPMYGKTHGVSPNEYKPKAKAEA